MASDPGGASRRAFARRAVAVALLVLGACGRDPAPTSGNAAATSPAAERDDDAAPAAPGQVATSAVAEPPTDAAPAAPTVASSTRAICHADGLLGFSVSGTGLAAHEGRTVWGAVVLSGARKGRVMARLEGRVERGAIALSCPRALPGGLGDATAFAIVDRDGKPGCSGGDGVLAAFTMYLVDGDVELTVPGGDGEVAVTDSPVSADLDLCAHIAR